MKTTSLMEWARREIDLATAGEMEEAPEMKEEMDKHFEAAYQAYCDFLERVEDLDKPGIAKTVFTQLLHEEPLTPIEDNEEDWTLVEGFDPASGNENPGWSIYQCDRRFSLFKKIIYAGDNRSTIYTDTARAVCMDINTQQMYTGGIGPKILDEMIPIKMPYQPLGKIKIFTEDFKCHEDSDEDFDTIGVLYFRMPDGQMKEVKRFFKEDYQTHEMVEIDKTEYFSRKKKAEGLKKKKINEFFDEERRPNK